MSRMVNEVQTEQARQLCTARRRRLRDEEWEPFRPKIEKLYYEQGFSRNTVVQKLSQDGFPFTENQLKHILIKWGIKKQTNSKDMHDMLAVKRKREEDRKATEFVYHGHVVDATKLQRAEKRYKAANSGNVTLPSYIKVSSPNPIYQILLQGQPTAHSPEIDQPSTRPPNLDSLGHRLSRRADISAANQQHMTFALTEPNLGVFFLGNGENEPFWHKDPAQTEQAEEESSPHSPRSFTSMINFDPDLLFTAELSANNTNSLITASRASAETTCPESPSMLRLYPGLPSPIPNSAITSPLATPGDFVISDCSNAYQPLSGPEHKPGYPSTRALFHGTDPESIIPAIHMMRKLFNRLQDDTFRYQYLTSRGMCKWRFHGEIKSELLLSAVDEVARWAYQSSADNVQQQEAARLSSCTNIHSLSRSPYRKPGQISPIHAWNFANESNSLRLIGKPISWWDTRTNCTTGGIFRIQLLQRVKEVSDGDEDDAKFTLAMSVIPKIGKCAEAGIHVTIPVVPEQSRGLPIFTTIRSFNVVPKDSEIIICVTKNDFEGVKRLIEDKKASPRDVDPRGVSLLCYAMLWGSSEIFRLLLSGGASTDECDVFSYPHNLIDSIWVTCIDLAIIAKISTVGFPVKYITNLGQCRSMTELALAHGCLAEQSVAFNDDFPTSLFRLSTIFRSTITRCPVAATLKQLLWAGYDKEAQNSNGQTPLLYTALCLSIRGLTMTELLLAENVNVHARDNEGRGALHLCVLFSHGAGTSFLDVCKGPISAINSGFCAGHPTTGDICEGRDVDSQHNNSILQEVLYCDECDDCIDEQADVDYVDYQEDDGRCYWCSENSWSGYKNLEDEEWLYYCKETDIDDFKMPESPDPEPEPWMYKARSRLKLLALLKAGCSPNLLDSAGLSPSDYARAEGLWPQWEWALSKSVFRYNEFTNLGERES